MPAVSSPRVFPGPVGLLIYLLDEIIGHGDN